MENIWTESIEKVKEGAKFKIELKRKNFYLNNKPIIKNGQYKGILGVEKIDSKTLLNNLNSFYQRYKHSIPSERNKEKRKRYFTALPEEELDSEDMLYGEPREEAQLRLELYILLCILNGSFIESEFFPDGHWFWQSKSDKDFIIIKNWIY